MIKIKQIKHVLFIKYNVCDIKQMWYKMGPLIQRDLMYAINKRNLSTMKRTEKTKDISKGWHEINWKKAEAKVKDLQEKIVIATLNNDLKKVYRIQWTMLSCL